MNHSLLLTKENLEHMFSLFDSNQDGQITISELKDVFSTTRQHSDESDYFLLACLREVDKNGDNMINFEEFESSLLL